MRNLAKFVLGICTFGALIAGSTAPGQAQYYYPYPPPPPRYYYPPPPPPPYGYYPRRWGGTYNGCPPHYTIQDGVCKPYRGY
jgi:hypothetical protein